MEHDLGGLLNRGVEFNVPEIMCLSKQLLEGGAMVSCSAMTHTSHRAALHSHPAHHPPRPQTCVDTASHLTSHTRSAANLLLNNSGVLKIADFGSFNTFSDVCAAHGCRHAGLARGAVKDGGYTPKVCTVCAHTNNTLYYCILMRFHSAGTDRLRCCWARATTAPPLTFGALAALWRSCLSAVPSCRCTVERCASVDITSFQGGVANAKDESEHDLDQFMQICQACMPLCCPHALIGLSGAAPPVPTTTRDTASCRSVASLCPKSGEHARVSTSSHVLHQHCCSFQRSLPSRLKKRCSSLLFALFFDNTQHPQLPREIPAWH